MSQLLTVSSVDSFILPTIYFMNYRLLYNIYIYYIVNVKYIYFSTLKPAPKNCQLKKLKNSLCGWQPPALHLTAI